MYINIFVLCTATILLDICMHLINSTRDWHEYITKKLKGYKKPISKVVDAAFFLGNIQLNSFAFLRFK